MTNQQTSPLDAPPPMSLEEQFSYYMGHLNMDSPARAQKALKAAADQAAHEFALGYEAMHKASGFTKAPPLERLIWYRQKPMTQEEALEPYADILAANQMDMEAAEMAGKEPMMQQPVPETYSWEEQMLKLPREYEEDWADWQNLRERALAGDFGPEQQAEEIAWSQQAAMAGMV